MDNRIVCFIFIIATTIATIKLLNKIIENNETKINVLPLCPDGPNRVLNSLCKVTKCYYEKFRFKKLIKCNEILEFFIHQ